MTAELLWHITRRPVDIFHEGLSIEGDRPYAIHADGQLWERLAEIEEPS